MFYKLTFDKQIYADVLHFFHRDDNLFKKYYSENFEFDLTYWGPNECMHNGGR